MSPRQQARLLDRLEREHGPSVRKAFEQAIRDLRSGVDFTALQRAIAAGDVGRAVAALHIGIAVYRDFELELADVLEKAGRAFTNIMPRNVRKADGTRVLFRFNPRQPRAEALLRRHAADKVTRLAEQDLRAMREILEASMRSGVAPRTTATRIAGSIDPTTGRRTGGLIGLSGPQTEYLQNARGYLEAGDRRYFAMTLRDRRFDGQIREAMEAGRAVPASLRERALNRYSDRMLQHRGEVIARTETLNAIRAGKHEAIDQAAELAGLPADAVQREWDSSGDSAVREDHQAADGQRVGKDEPFIVGGEPLMYPGDANGSAKQTANCRCVEIARINWNRASN